jgi:hypothetical protein
MDELLARELAAQYSQGLRFVRLVQWNLRTFDEVRQG